jgi:protease I
MDILRGVKVAILVTDGFEQVELTEPRKALEEAGAETTIVSPKSGQVRGWNSTDWGDEFSVDVDLQVVRSDDFDALLLPGGVMNPDFLRLEQKAIEFIRSFFDALKPVAAICHGPWPLIDAGVARGKRIAAWPSLKSDLSNAGAEWIDQEVCVDGKLVSSRKPNDLPAFNREIIKVFSRAQSRAA